MATKRKRGPTWFYTVKNSKLLPKPLNLSFQNEAEGDAYVSRLEKLLAAGIVPAELSAMAGAIVTLADAIREYQHEVSVGRADRPLLDLVSEENGQVRLSRIDYAWVEQYIKGLKRDRRLSPSTIRHRVGAVARCFDWLSRRGDLVGNPWRLLPKGYATYTDADASFLAALGQQSRQDASRDRRLEDGERAKIISVLESNFVRFHRPAVRFLFELELRTGMRLRELFTLEVPQVQLDKRTIFLDRTKNGHRRQVPLSAEAMELCRRYLESLPSDAVRLFPWLESGSDADLARVTALLSRQFARVFERAGCPDLTFHDLRHEFTCWLYEHTDFSDVEIAQVLGWRSLKMALRYANLRGSRLADRFPG